MILELIDPRIFLHACRLEVREEQFSWNRVMKQCRLFSARARQRRQLRELTDSQLKDIGVSRVDALQEARKPFWVD
jgi:uncharacterized protein YjiS (DUF1127 family)